MPPCETRKRKPVQKFNFKTMGGRNPTSPPAEPKKKPKWHLELKNPDGTSASFLTTGFMPLLAPPLLRDNCLLMLLDRDTRRGPRTRVLAVITRRSVHCSLRTHKPGSPLLLCLGHTPMPLASPSTHSSIAPFYPASLNPRTHTQNLQIPNF